MSTNEASIPFDLGGAKMFLNGGPGRFASLLAGIPEIALHRNEGGESWTPSQVVGHVLDAEHHAWLPRLDIILRGDSTVVLPVFDRFAHLKRYANTPLPELLVRLASARAQSLADLDAYQLDEYALGMTAIHPTLGPVTASQLLSTWVAHDWSHHAQVVRTIAGTMRAAVGPWADFLTVMQPRSSTS